jgi:GTP-binding protein EngB required for normal cell division
MAKFIREDMSLVFLGVKYTNENITDEVIDKIVKCTPSFSQVFTKSDKVDCEKTNINLSENEKREEFTTGEPTTDTLQKNIGKKVRQD